MRCTHKLITLTISLNICVFLGAMEESKERTKRGCVGAESAQPRISKRARTMPQRFKDMGQEEEFIEEQWGMALCAEIDQAENGLLQNIEIMLRDGMQNPALRKQLNSAFVYASWKPSEAISIQIMKLFLEHTEININYNDRESNGATALLNACLLQRLDAIQFLVAQPALDLTTPVLGMKVYEWIATSPLITNREAVASLYMNAVNARNRMLEYQAHANQQVDTQGKIG